MAIDYPWALALIPLVAVPWLLYKPLTVFLFSSFLPVRGKRGSGSLSIIMRSMMSAVIIGFILGLSGISSEWVRMAGRIEEGAQIVWVLDGSGSMDSALSSGEPTKRVLAAQIIESFIRARGRDQYALIDFGGSAVTRSPFDFDKERFISVLHTPSPDLITTVIGPALERAVYMFPKDEWTGSRAIILVSDGAGSIDNLDSLVVWMKKWRITFWWVFIGSEYDWRGSDLAHDLVARLGPQAKKYRGDKKEELSAALADMNMLQRGLIRLPREAGSLRMDRYFYASSFAALTMLGLLVAGESMVTAKKEHTL